MEKIEKPRGADYIDAVALSYTYAQCIDTDDPRLKER